MYWRADPVDAEGRVLEEMLGNGVSTTRTFDPATGLVRTVQSGLGETSGVQDLGYVFDGLGNLTTREDFIQDVYESFAYAGSPGRRSATPRTTPGGRPELRL